MKHHYVSFVSHGKAKQLGHHDIWYHSGKRRQRPEFFGYHHMGTPIFFNFFLKACIHSRDSTAAFGTVSGNSVNIISIEL
jgi:hypothetical protein